MKLYFSKGACSLATRITLNELGIGAEYESVDLKTKKTATGEDFLKINPKGAVPAILLDDKTVLTENAAILQYLADLKKADHLLPPVFDRQRYSIIEWLNFIATDLHKGCGVFFNPLIPDTLKNTLFRPLLVSKLKRVEDQLAKTAWIGGSHFTLPDAYLFVILRWLPYIQIDMVKDFPQSARYFETLKNRDSVMKSLKEEDLA
ncbi:MAG TPA: glutathione transferase GstA [Gammaproteobacteria bacterium]|nr:glutathione transferase GstA [Gammaproteobacteria bacterium]